MLHLSVFRIFWKPFSCFSSKKMRYLKVVSKKKNKLYVWGWDRKIWSSGSSIVITRQALWCQSLILGTDFSIPSSHSWWILILQPGQPSQAQQPQQSPQQQPQNPQQQQQQQYGYGQPQQHSSAPSQGTLGSNVPIVSQGPPGSNPYARQAAGGFGSGYPRPGGNYPSYQTQW